MRLHQNSTRHESSIVALDKFIQATRDSGYKGTASALAELVDNSIQAGASRVAISVIAASESPERGIDVSVLDDGCGMDPFTLRQALRFGGSTRFGKRNGLGRYGMGLPNASLSQAKRVTVYSWQATKAKRSGAARDRRKGDAVPERVYMSYLDVDEIARGEMEDVPRPELIKAPPPACKGGSGTLVAWTRCDHLDNRRVSTIVRKLEIDLGRRFRHFLWKGLRITINGHDVRALDPLYLHAGAEVSGAHLFGEDLRYEVQADPDDPRTTGWVTVRFSELPVHEWHRLSNDEKRRIGISKGAGVSIVRAGREVDSGWFFMGTKHRENYDDWWRCEIQFDPILDEAFGITHTKQQVRPQAHLIEALTTEIEATARALNARARRAHLAVKAGERFSEAERLANERDGLLSPLPRKPAARARALMQELTKHHPGLRRSSNEAPSRYRIIEDGLKDTCFFGYVYDGELLVLILNPNHPFYREIYKPLAEGDSPRDQQLRAKVELLLLAAARSEAGARRDPALTRHRLEWSNTLATFLNG